MTHSDPTTSNFPAPPPMTLAGPTTEERGVPFLVGVCGRFAYGYPENAFVPSEDMASYRHSLSAALTMPYFWDAHAFAYVPTVDPVWRRLAGVDALANEPCMTLAIFDVDGRKLADDRAKVDRLLADHPGGYVYSTRGGYRVVYQLGEQSVTLRDRADVARWSATYNAWCDYLATRYEIAADRACSDWTRLYRLPCVTRDGEPQDPETIGDANAIGEWAPVVAIAANTNAAPVATASPSSDRIADGTRNDTLTSLAGRMRFGGMSESEIDAALQVANTERCDPPLDESEVSAIARSVGRYEPTLDASAKPIDYAAIARRTSSSLPTNASTESARYGVDIADFLAQPDEGDDTYLVEGLIPAAMPAMLVGPPKSRKSWTELYLAVCIAAGVPAFGRKTTRARVLVIAREDTARETRRRLRLIMAGLGIDPDRVRGWLRVDCMRPLYLDKSEDACALMATLEEWRPAVVMIDSLSRIHLADENSRSEMATITNVWADLCSRYSCTILILHHVTKMGDGRTLMQRIRGTGDLAAVVRIAIGVEPKKGKTEDTSVKLDVVRAARPVDAPAADPLATPLVGELLDVLLECGTATVTTLRRGRGGKDAVDDALADMLAGGLIRPVMRRRKHCGFELTESGKVFARGTAPNPATVN